MAWAKPRGSSTAPSSWVFFSAHAQNRSRLVVDAEGQPVLADEAILGFRGKVEISDDKAKFIVNEVVQPQGPGRRPRAHRARENEVAEPWTERPTPRRCSTSSSTIRAARRWCSTSPTAGARSRSRRRTASAWARAPSSSKKSQGQGVGRQGVAGIAARGWPPTATRMPI